MEEDREIGIEDFKTRRLFVIWLLAPIVWDLLVYTLRLSSIFLSLIGIVVHLGSCYVICSKLSFSLVGVGYKLRRSNEFPFIEKDDSKQPPSFTPSVRNSCLFWTVSFIRCGWMLLMFILHLNAVLAFALIRLTSSIIEFLHLSFFIYSRRKSQKAAENEPDMGSVEDANEFPEISEIEEEITEE